MTAVVDMRRPRASVSSGSRLKLMARGSQVVCFAWRDWREVEGLWIVEECGRHVIGASTSSHHVGRCGRLNHVDRNGDAFRGAGGRGDLMDQG